MSNIFEQKLLRLISDNLRSGNIGSEYINLSMAEEAYIAKSKLDSFLNNFTQKFFEKHKKEIMESLNGNYFKQ